MEAQVIADLVCGLIWIAGILIVVGLIQVFWPVQRIAEGLRKASHEPLYEPAEDGKRREVKDSDGNPVTVAMLDMEEGLRIAGKLKTRLVAILFGFAALALICATVIVTVDSRSQALEALHEETLEKALKDHVKLLKEAAEDLLREHMLRNRDANQQRLTPPSSPEQQDDSAKAADSPAENAEQD